MTDTLRRTALFDLHHEEGAKMVPFAGWDMPVQYASGVLNEHLHTRANAGLFDVGHMGQVRVIPEDGRLETAALALESLIPADIVGLAPGRQRYGIFTDDEGGILDDLMIIHRGDHYLLVVNAACADQDIAHLRSLTGVRIEPLTDHGLIALQGPLAEQALARLLPEVTEMRFMDAREIDWDGAPLLICRSGYTGEDGFEISVPNSHARKLAETLLEFPEVAPIGLGARDSLRLEAGLCLYGHDIDTTTTPVEGALEWAMQKVRRTGGARAGGFPGASRILEELETGAARRRVGLLPEGRAPMREGTPLYAAETGGDPVGEVTSGGFGPSIARPMSMGYLPMELSASGTTVWGEVRGRRMAAIVTDLPFRPATYKR